MGIQTDNQNLVENGPFFAYLVCETALRNTQELVNKKKKNFKKRLFTLLVMDIFEKS